MTNEELMKTFRSELSAMADRLRRNLRAGGTQGGSQRGEASEREVAALRAALSSLASDLEGLAKKLE